jgi:chromosome segregation ATPase
MRSLVCTLLLLAACCAHDQPSVADAARKNRKGATPPATKKVYTNDDMAPGKNSSSPELTLPEPSKDAKASNKMSLTPDQVAIVKEKIARFKTYIASLEARRMEIKKWQEDRKNETAQCAAQQQAYGYSACDVVKEYQQELNQVESKLKSAQSELGTYQEKIRQMGYGSSVWDAS